MDELELLEKLAHAATPGPWIAEYTNIYGPLDQRSKNPNGRVRIAIVLAGGARLDPELPELDTHDADTAFIAAANPAVVLRLIAEIRAMRTNKPEQMHLFEQPQ